MSEEFRYMTIDDYAQAFKGNWQRFGDFAWHTQYELDDPEEFGLYYYNNRDADVLEQSNAAYIKAEMAEFPEADCWLESHNHWAVGWVECVVVRVYQAEKYPLEYTDAFKRLWAILQALTAYPILDEDDFSAREYDAQCDGITDACWRFDTTDWPEDWVEQIWHKLEPETVDYAKVEAIAIELFGDSRS